VSNSLGKGQGTCGPRQTVRTLHASTGGAPGPCSSATKCISLPVVVAVGLNPPAGDIPSGGGEHDRSETQRDDTGRTGREAVVEAPASPPVAISGRSSVGIPAVAVAGACYILHLRESTPRSEEYCRQRGLGGVFGL